MPSNAEFGEQLRALAMDFGMKADMWADDCDAVATALQAVSDNLMDAASLVEEYDAQV